MRSVDDSVSNQGAHLANLQAATEPALTTSFSTPAFKPSASSPSPNPLDSYDALPTVPITLEIGLLPQGEKICLRVVGAVPRSQVQLWIADVRGDQSTSPWSGAHPTEFIEMLLGQADGYGLTEFQMNVPLLAMGCARHAQIVARGVATQGPNAIRCFVDVVDPEVDADQRQRFEEAINAPSPRVLAGSSSR